MALVQTNFPATNVSPGATIMDPSVRMTTTTANGGSRLAQMQARFQQKQLQEKEQKLLRLYESQQQRAFQRVAARGSAGSSSVSSVSSNNSSMSVGKVRQMFDERRSNGGTGWDRSYPLEPLDGSLNKSRGAPPAAKTKANRVASLDRSQNNNNVQQVTKTNVKRSKSHARGGVTSEVNGSYRRQQQQQNSVHTDYNASFRRLAVDDEDGGYRKVSNTERFSDSFRVQPGRLDNDDDDFDGSYTKTRNNREDLNASNRRTQLNYGEDVNESFRRQESDNIHSYQRDQYEEDINYERLGEDIQQLNGNQTFTVIDDKRREDLFAKYQVRDVENNELLSASPPPELFNDDEEELDDSFVFKKLPNVGGPLLLDETSAAKGSDKFKTYNASKHKREESKKMSPPAADVKKGGLARRESASPPPKASNKPAAKRAEAKVISPPPGARRPAPAALPKQSSSTQSKTSSSSSNSTTAMPKTTIKKSTPTVNQRGSPTSTASQKQSVPAGRTPLRTLDASPRDDLAECKICNRRFATDRIEKHESICNRTSQKKRKEYDATKHRVKGTEAEIYVKRASKQRQPQKQVPSKKEDWRKKHEDFIATIRAAKQAQAHIKAGGNIRDLPPPPPLDTSDYIQCPHCLRKFNEGAAERHIPRCATMLHNKPKPAAATTSRGAAGGVRRR